MRNDFGRTSKEAIAASFELLSKHVTGRTLKPRTS
jgi:hypothetical protein